MRHAFAALVLILAAPVASQETAATVYRSLLAPVEVCHGDRVVTFREVRRGEIFEEAHCLGPLEAVEVAPDGAFEARAWHYAPNDMKACRYEPGAPRPCCLRPGYILEPSGEEAEAPGLCDGIGSDPSPAAVACGWRATDFDLTGCHAECLAELEAAGWPGIHSSQPGQLLGVTCCARVPLSPPSPLPADVGRCHARWP